MKVMALMNPAVFDLSYAGIGFHDGSNDCILAAYKNGKAVFNKLYKRIEWAKRAFKRIFAKDVNIEPE